MIQNGVIINGVTYEFAPVKNENVADCEQCDLFKRCHYTADLLCRNIFYQNIGGMAFQKLTKQ